MSGERARLMAALMAFFEDEAEASLADVPEAQEAVDAYTDVLMPVVDRMLREAQAKAWHHGYGSGRDDEANGLSIRNGRAAILAGCNEPDLHPAMCRCVPPGLRHRAAALRDQP